MQKLLPQLGPALKAGSKNPANGDDEDGRAQHTCGGASGDARRADGLPMAPAAIHLHFAETLLPPFRVSWAHVSWAASGGHRSCHKLDAAAAVLGNSCASPGRSDARSYSSREQHGTVHARRGAPTLHPPGLCLVGRATVQVPQCSAEVGAVPGGALRCTGTIATTATSTLRTTRYVPLHAVCAAVCLPTRVASLFPPRRARPSWCHGPHASRAVYTAVSCISWGKRKRVGKSRAGMRRLVGVNRGVGRRGHCRSQSRHNSSRRDFFEGSDVFIMCGGGDVTQPSVRRQHNTGYKHKANVRAYYQQFEQNLSHNIAERSMKCALPPVPCEPPFRHHPTNECPWKT